MGFFLLGVREGCFLWERRAHLKGLGFLFLWGVRSLWVGLKLALNHLWRAFRRRPPTIYQGVLTASGRVTLPYPHEKASVPENGHYRLYLFTEDCIGCDQCARICPVSCITIEKVKAPQTIHHTASGHPKKFYITRFDIDHALCCFCGLCTVVCPTDCLIMEPEYAYATADRNRLVYRFGECVGESAAE
jgi:formate hydrogenlyase subunit 6/NADH:ubiquinone oxidoreductase subunit I